ncbi:MAG: hypothetical protein JST28_22265 [Acidobacteria bacterium]|nr:hypothetical protein [Acidobacteriota bacterium]
MAGLGAKQIIYIYNGNESIVDAEFDDNGDFPEPPLGSIVWRSGRRWIVERTLIEPMSSDPRMIPVLKINLSNRN